MKHLVPDAIEDFNTFLNLLENTIYLSLELSTRTHLSRFSLHPMPEWRSNCDLPIAHFD